MTRTGMMLEKVEMTGVTLAENAKKQAKELPVEIQDNAERTCLFSVLALSVVPRHVGSLREDQAVDLAHLHGWKQSPCSAHSRPKWTLKLR